VHAFCWLHLSQHFRGSGSPRLVQSNFAYHRNFAFSSLVDSTWACFGSLAVVVIILPRSPGDVRGLPWWATQLVARSTMSASLIGRSGSSAFRLSTTTVSMSLTGSCFSTESAPRPFHHGISKTRWNNLLGGLAVRQTAGPNGHTISPHPSSREGHHSTAQWNSSFLLIACTALMLLRLPWSTGTRCRQPICGA
jgi:hypothetical protein